MLMPACTNWQLWLAGQSSAAPVLFDVFDALPKINWFSKPRHQLNTISVCESDGYLAGGQCQAM
ncbi:MAG: hypothetical protein ACKPHU_11310, partial [Planctomycetaceae bacterium]